MRYEYRPNDPARYSTNLRREQGTRNLMWDNARGQDVLLVQTPFEVSAVNMMESLCVAMENTTIYPDRYTEVKPGVYVRFVTAADKARMGGCPINTEASTYTVFSCLHEGDTCAIFAPQNQAMISAYCNIPMEIHVDVWEQTRKEGFIKKKVVSTGYYVFTFPAGFADGYKNGELAYKVSNMTIPITKQMLEVGEVYIKTEYRPEILSRNKGLKLI